MWIHHFEYKLDKSKILFLEMFKDIYVPFDWTKMDVFRPAPRYVEHDDRFWWCHYLNKRQWKRGFHMGTNFWISNDDVGVPDNVAIRDILTEWFRDPPLTRVVNAGVDDAILTPTIAIQNGHIFHRRTVIAEWNERLGKYYLNKPQFRTEIEQYVKGASFVD
jgi:hypothetical protein